MYHVVQQRAPLGLHSSVSDVIILVNDVIITVRVRMVFYRLS